ncbi:uncharacterized protein BDZ99DRAFT_459503 [Mytilinidion resinicola]|uniref:NACHT domain-containing protein n=1 Tax=Mytilinidion resinicola TaxID=574789 RepID=A0A6A6Z0I5_9PEZI|nr:uncharacterized protein BDZ99DRAFT_459503 [Mytilinidion resinicola]KAF2813737.1 hypothetical protein BDZ99DRAFT_459503 [Mytilinidion resinicola]
MLVEQISFLEDNATDLQDGFIVVDAIDEINGIDGYGEDVRDTFLDVLRGLAHSYHILCTSRPHINVAEYFETVLGITIEATEGDLQIYLESKVAASKRLKGFVAKDKTLNTAICRTIIEKSCGMFVVPFSKLSYLEFPVTDSRTRVYYCVWCFNAYKDVQSNRPIAQPVYSSLSPSEVA